VSKSEAAIKKGKQAKKSLIESIKSGIEKKLKDARDGLPVVGNVT
jgi:hypothetical protein